MSGWRKTLGDILTAATNNAQRRFGEGYVENQSEPEAAQTTAPAKKIAAVSFVGPIMHPWTEKLRNLLCGYANDGVTHLVLYMSSWGGSIIEGFALYNLLKSMPYHVHIHNMGTVQSIANVVFMAGQTRSASPESSFLFHGFTMTFTQETLDEMQIAERTLGLGTGRAEFIRIFEQETTFTAKHFEDQKLFERAKVILPSEAKAVKIISDIEHLKLPPGIPILNIATGN